MSVWLFIWHYLSKVKFFFFGALIIIMVAELCRQTGFYFASRIPGVLNEPGNTDDLLKKGLIYAGLLGFLTLLRTVVLNYVKLINAHYLPRVRMWLTRDLFHRAHKHSMQFFSEEMSGRVASKINNTIDNVFDLRIQFEKPFTSFCRLSISFYFLTRIHLTMGLALILFVILYMAFLYISSKKMIAYSEISHNKASIANGVLVDTLFNQNLVKNDGDMFFERRHYFKTLIPWIRAEKKVYITEYLMYTTQGFMRGLLQIMFLSIPLYYWLNHQISVADFVLAESLISYLTMFSLNIAGSVSRFYRDIGGIKDGLDFIYQPLQITDKPGAATTAFKKGRIEFKDVSFMYRPRYSKNPPKPLFTHFNLNIQPGDKVGLVGSSGSGKSSLVKLLNRYYDVDEGSILIDNFNVAEVTQESLHSQIALIPQDPSLFNRTIMENIRYGQLKATDKQVIAAAKKAYIHDLIMRLPEKYNTRVGERGITLSGGERQRIAIARAILKKAPILILDEATSALDSESELYIQKALKEIMKNKTVIAIAHRLSTLKEMDYLLVMQNGKIIEKGTHAALLRRQGAYYDFYKLQTQALKRDV